MNFFALEIFEFLKIARVEKLDIRSRNLLFYGLQDWQTKSTVSEGDSGQISALTLDCGAIEYYIILPLVVFF
jgi:hypothetical protein